MPAGLDGNPDPIQTTERDAVLRAVTDRVCAHDQDRVVEGIDGRSGAGKSTFADEPADTPLESVTGVASHAVLVFDGLFLHRDEFAELWDVSVFLDADERRNADWLEFLLDDLPANSTPRAAELDRRLDLARWPRYRHGWSSSIDDLAPHRRATMVVDNNDLACRRILVT